jgi:hypothetical protein
MTCATTGAPGKNAIFTRSPRMTSPRTAPRPTTTGEVRAGRAGKNDDVIGGNDDIGMLLPAVSIGAATVGRA